MIAGLASRRVFLLGLGAAAVPASALPALAAPGDDTELLRLHAELRPIALEYGRLGDRWREAESDFSDWLAGRGLTDALIRATVSVDEWFDMRLRHGVELLVEQHNDVGGAMDAILAAINSAPVTTAAGVGIKLDATLLAIGTNPRLVFADPSQEWARARIDDFLGDLRPLLGNWRTS